MQVIYEAFGRGDVDTILSKLTDDVDFGPQVGSTIAPWHGRRTKAEVPGFFEAIGKTIDVTEFTPLAFTSNDTDVMAVIRFGFTVRDTGKSVTMDLNHWWRFRDDGKIYFYRGAEDTAKTAWSLTP